MRITALLLLVACTGDPADSKTRTGSPGGGTPETGDPDTGDPDDDAPVDGCRATPLADGAPRLVAISHPYTDSGAQSDAWELLTLEDDALSSAGITFEMGRGGGGPVVWAPDGSLGVAVQDDGTLGVFTSAGEVVETGWSADTYADDVVFDPSGETLWLIDGNWVENGGGVYEIAVDCDTGALSLVGLIVESKLGSHLLGDVLIADASAQTLDLETGALGTAVPLFGYDDPIVGGAARRGDTLYIGDNSLFASDDNRVVVLSADGPLTVTAELEIEDPYAIAAVSEGAIVASGFGDAIVAMGPDGALLDSVSSPLPGAISLGPDELALIAEVDGLRALRLQDGALVDVSYFATTGVADMIGSVGVQP